MPITTVVLDANVLYPLYLCDTLLQLAETGIFVPRWTAQIIEEVRRNLEERYPEDRVRRRLTQMRTSFGSAEITGYEALIDAMPNDKGDRHVLAAAVSASIPLIVTENTADLPAHLLEPLGVIPMTAEHFLASLYEDRSGDVRDVLLGQARAYRNPSMTIDDLLIKLSPYGRSLMARIAADRL